MKTRRYELYNPLFEQALVLVDKNIEIIKNLETAINSKNSLQFEDTALQLADNLHDIGEIIFTFISVNLPTIKKLKDIGDSTLTVYITPTLDLILSNNASLIRITNDMVEAYTESWGDLNDLKPIESLSAGIVHLELSKTEIQKVLDKI